MRKWVWCGVAAVLGALDAWFGFGPVGLALRLWGAH